MVIRYFFIKALYVLFIVIFASTDTVQAQETNDAITIENQFMRDIITMQRQSGLIEGLIARQRELQTIAGNYEKIGVPFKQPPPPKSVCEKLPANVLCMSFYPGLTVNQSIIDIRQEAYQQESHQNLLNSVSSVNIDRDVNVNNSDANTDFDYQAPPSLPSYSWSDLRCMGDNCSVLLVRNDNQDQRLRVKMGDSFGDLKVTSITFDKILGVQDGEIITIKPLSLDGSVMADEEENTPINMVSTANQDNNPVDIQGALENNFAKAFDNNPEFQNGSTSTSPTNPANESPNNQELLGPTGLF